MSEDTILKIILQAKDEASGVLGKIGSGLKGALVGGAVAAGAAIVGLTAILGDCVSEAMAAEEVMAQTNAVLKSTGGVSGMTADSVSALAQSLSEVTKFEDDAIQSGENLLLTFTNIGADVFPQATEAMLNISQAMGTDLKSSALQLGKALNDPVAGISALTRVGVTFTEAQKEQIKAMTEAGDVAGAQKIILAELEREFGGVARAAGETLAGKLEILKNQFGNVKEQVGAALIPVLSDLATKYGPLLIQFAQDAAAWIVSTLIPALGEIAKWCGENLPPVIDALALLWQNVLLPAITAIWSFVVTSLIPALTDIVTWLAVNLPPVVQAMATFWTETLQPAIQAVWQVISNVITIVGDVIGKIGEFVAFLGTLKIPNPFQGLLDTINNIIGAVQSALGWISKLGGANAGAAGGYTPPTNYGGVPITGGFLTNPGNPTGASSTKGTTAGDTYYITVNTAATAGTYVADIAMARALAGA